MCVALEGQGHFLFCSNMCCNLVKLLFEEWGLLGGVALWPRQLLMMVHSWLLALCKLLACLRDRHVIVPSFALAFGRIGQVFAVAACRP